MIKIGGYELLANLIVLDMYDFDVILGMDWVAAYHASMDCFAKTISFRIDLVSGLMSERAKKASSTPMISAFKAERLIQIGFEGRIAFITENKQSKKLEDISVVYEFPDVFLEEISGLPPVREIDLLLN